MLRSSWRVAVLSLVLAFGVAEGAVAQAGRAAGACEGGEYASTAADSLFSLARERARTGEYVLVPFTRKPSVLPSRGSVDWGALGPQQVERLSQGTPPLVAYLLGEDGAPIKVEVVRSSGDARVDELVAATYRQRQYKPARAGRCAVPYFGVEPFRMRVRTETRVIPARGA
jgi:hypothetical protein